MYKDEEWKRHEQKGIPAPKGDYGYQWPQDMVENFAALWELSGFVMTLSGSYWNDEEQFPGFWSDVYLCRILRLRARQKVEATLDTVHNRNGKQA